MIGIVVEDISLARPFIQLLKLQRDFDCKTHQIFQAPNLSLILVAGDELEVASATTLLITRLTKRYDELVLAGLSKSSADEMSVDAVALVHKILDPVRARAYYPDILLKHNFPEVQLTSQSSRALLYAFSQTISSFINSSQYALFSVEESHFDLSAAQRVYEHLCKVEAMLLSREKILNAEEEKLLESLSLRIKISRTQSERLKVLASSFKSRNPKALLAAQVAPFLGTSVDSKTQAKKVFDELSRALST